jgi:hypothetical protein
VEGVFTEAFKSLASQGTGWLLFVLACGVIIWLTNRLLNAQQACDVIRETLNEKRIAEARETISALNNSSQSNAELARNIDTRTKALETLTQVVSQMERTSQSVQTYWQGRTDEMNRKIDNVISRLEELQRRPA